MILLLFACTKATPSTSEPWTLVWSDEFSIDGALDDESWNHDVGGDGWGNDQLEHNTDRLDNVFVSDGWLNIRAMREDYEGNDWTSGRVHTMGKREFQSGKFAARIQLPPGKGMWPAFWMLGANFEDVGWPNCGEIDILEARGEDPYTVNTALHGPGHSGGDAYHDTLTVEDDLQADAHVYSVEWDDDHIAWFIDDTLIDTAHPGDLGGSWVYDHEMFLILNVAVGGHYVQAPDETTPDSSTMFVDYVRVFERNR